MRVSFDQSNLARRAKPWALGLWLHDPYVFKSFEDFNTPLRQTFQPPWDDVRASSVTTNPVHEHTLLKVLMQGLADGPVKNHLFRLELDTL